jgi:FkbM family methyltransferase
MEKINRGDTVFDIGANHGYYTHLFSALTGKTGHIHGFEPIPETFDKLKYTTRSLINTKINHCALGKNSGQAKIHYNLRDSEKASFIYRSKTMNKQYETMIITLDEYVLGQHIDRVDFIKCDVEGFELEVLYGAYKTLIDNKPQLSVEITLCEKDLRELFTLLWKIGYRDFRRVEKGFPKIDLDDYHFDKNEFFYLYATH